MYAGLTNNKNLFGALRRGLFRPIGVGVCVCVFFMAASQSVSAQVAYSLGTENAYIANTEQEAIALKDDSLKANAFLKLSLLWRRMNNPEKSKHYLEQGTALAHKYPMLKAAAFYYQSIINYVPGDIASLEKNLLKSDSLLKPFTQAEAHKLRGIIWNNYAILQQARGDEKKAMDVFTNKAMPSAKLSGDFMVLGKTYKGISIIFMNADQRDKAAGYLSQAIEAIRKSPLENPVNLTELIEAYITAGENYVYAHRYDSARKVIAVAKSLLAPYPTSNLYMIYYYAEGVYLDRMQAYTEAIRSFDAGINLSTKLNSPYSLNRLKFAKYKSLSAQKRYPQAIAVLEDLLKSPYVLESDKKIYYQDLYTLYDRIGDSKNAFRWSSQYITLSDSLYEQKIQKEIAELESKYKHAEDQAEIAALQAEREKSEMAARNNRVLNILLGIISLFLLATALLAIKVYRQRVARYRQTIKDAEQQQQIQLAKALMQGEEKERKRLAIDLHDGLGGQLAGIKINLSRMATSDGSSGMDLHKVIDQLDASSNELRRIARNMMPESLLLLGLEPALKDMCESLNSEKTQVVFQPFDISPALPREMQMNIYRMVQELLTNAIRHAAATEILVQCSQNSDRFFITIEDNGKGFDTATLGKKPGIGLSNVQSRVEYLKGKIDISSGAGEGTTINIEFDVTAQ